MAKLSPETKASAQRANELLREIGKVRRAREVRQGRLDERAQRLQDQHGPAIEALKSQEETLVDELVKLVVPVSFCW